MSATVYRAFDATGRLLYVGCTVEIEARLRQHEQHAQWWVFQDRITTEEFGNRREALEAESQAILTEHPRWNMAGRSDLHPDGKCSAVTQAKWLDYERDVANRHRRLLADEARLLKQLRKVRMGLAGTRCEIEALKTGFELDLEDIA